MPQLTAEHKRKMAEGRRRYLADKQAKLKNWEQKAIAAQGGERPSNGKTSPATPLSPPPLRDPFDFENMSLEEVRVWVTDARKHWDDAIKALQAKEQQWATDHTSVACACGCGQLIDLSRGRFASSESYRDETTFQIKTRYWATQRCVQAFRLAQSPQYKDQLRREMEEKMTAHYVKSDVLD